MIGSRLGCCDEDTVTGRSNAIDVTTPNVVLVISVANESFRGLHGLTQEKENAVAC